MNSVFKGKLDNIQNIAPFSHQVIHEPSDEVLLDRFLKGSRRSYEILVLRYKKRIFEFIYFQIKQHSHDAEDLTQEVFIELYKKAASYRNEAKFSTYLFSIARNMVLNYFRTTSRRFSLLKLFQSNEEPETKSPQEKFIDIATQRQIMFAVNSLNVEERQIIYLCDKENFSYTQISNILNIKVGTVRSRLNTARQKIVQELRESSHEM